MENSNLPVPKEKFNLPEIIKKTTIKGLKVAGALTATAVSGIVIVGTFAAGSPLVIPATLAGIFVAQKLADETIYKSYKDLSFVTLTNKFNNNVRISQDGTKLGITSELLKMTSTEKAGAMQLQALVGMSKFNSKDKKGREYTFTSITHGINRKTFKKLEELGYIKDYEEVYKKDSYLLLEKLTFGNLKGFGVALRDKLTLKRDSSEKVEMYSIKFKRTDKPMDFNDPELRKSFRIIFDDRKGILMKYGYEIEEGKNGELSINYHPRKRKNKVVALPDGTGKVEIEQKSDFIQELRDNVPTQLEQKTFVENFKKKNEHEKGEGIIQSQNNFEGNSR